MPYRLERDHAVAWLLALWPIPVGAVMIVFSERFTSRSWRFAAGIPGGYATWAGMLVVCGVLMVSAMIFGGTRREAGYFAGLILVGLWWLILGGLFTYTACIDQLANPLGGAVWTPIGILYWMWAYFEYKHIR
jgi:hypothetical protein